MTLRKLASNSSYLLIDWFLLAILSSLFWIISGRLLDSTKLGVISTAFNLASIIQFFSTLGIGQALVKLVSEYAQNGRQSSIINIIRPAVKIVLISNVLILGLMILFSQSLSSIFRLAPEIILITTLITTFLAFSSIAGFILVGFQNMRRLMLTNLFYLLMKIIVTAVLLILGFGVFGPLIGITLGLISLVVLRFGAFQLDKYNLKSQDHYEELFKFAIPAFISGISLLAFNNVPYITLTVLKDLSITGIFTPAMLLVSPLFIFPTAFSSALLPIISGLSTKTKNENEKTTLIKVTLRYTIFLLFPLAALLILFPEQIILLLFKSEYLPAVEFVKILSIGAVFQGLGGIFLSSIYALKRPEVQQNIFIVAAVLFTLLSLPFTYYLSAIGMSIAYMLANSVLFLLSYFYIRKLILVKLPYKDISKISIATVVIVSFILITKPLVSSNLAILLIIPTGIIYFISLLYLNFYNSLDLRLLKFLSNRAPKYLKSSVNVIYILIKGRVQLSHN